MLKLKYGAALLGLGLAMAAVIGGQAQAVPAPSCDNIYTTANGAQTYPGTFVGTVGGNGSGNICQIGRGLSNQGPTVINGSIDPVIYSFLFGGGDITIEQYAGNNGVFNANTDWNAFLVRLDENGNPVEELAVLDIPFSSGPSYSGVLYDGFLEAGYYAIKNTVGDDYEDPQFQINFSTTPVPEPMTIGLLGAGLFGLGAAARRRRRA